MCVRALRRGPFFPLIRIIGLTCNRSSQLTSKQMPRCDLQRNKLRFTRLASAAMFQWHDMAAITKQRLAGMKFCLLSSFFMKKSLWFIVFISQYNFYMEAFRRFKTFDAKYFHNLNWIISFYVRAVDAHVDVEIFRPFSDDGRASCICNIKTFPSFHCFSSGADEKYEHSARA